MIIDRPGGSLLIDTGWTPDQAEALVRWAKKSLSSPIATAVGTHFHNDRIGGVEILRKNSIPILAHPLTCSLAEKLGVPVPEAIAEFNGRSYRLNADCELFFPGAGHTRDNIVAWLPQQGVLFCGCLLKSSTAADLATLLTPSFQTGRTASDASNFNTQTAGWLCRDMDQLQAMR
jgi:metallo-beta-lactamase class B